MLHILKL